MKAIAVNGSPRKGWNTDMLLQQALKGAGDAHRNFIAISFHFSLLCKFPT